MYRFGRLCVWGRSNHSKWSLVSTGPGKSIRTIGAAHPRTAQIGNTSARYLDGRGTCIDASRQCLSRVVPLFRIRRVRICNERWKALPRSRAGLHDSDRTSRCCNDVHCFPNRLSILCQRRIRWIHRKCQRYEWRPDFTW